jgi:hypothetical protein
MLGLVMQPPGSFKIRRTRRDAPAADPLPLADTRTSKIVDSLCLEILEGENLRIRQVFEQPRAIYRIELDKPEMNYQRITLLDEDTLEELLEIDEVRNRVARALSFGAAEKLPSIG